MLVSPLIRGNRVYGGVDPKTGLTYGFDRATGEPIERREVDEYVEIAITVYCLLAGGGLVLWGLGARDGTSVGVGAPAARVPSRGRAGGVTRRAPWRRTSSTRRRRGPRGRR